MAGLDHIKPGHIGSRATVTADAYRRAAWVRRESWSEWLDRHSRHVFIAPAIVMIVIFAIFPTVASLIIAVSRIKLTGGGYTIRFVGLQNFYKQFIGTEQIHFLGRLTAPSPVGWMVTAIVVGACLWWLYRYIRNDFSVIGLIGRLISAGMAIGIAFMVSATALSGTLWGTLGTTLFIVFLGCALQFAIGLGLAVLCSQPIWGRSFFRIVFFVPLMITPLGVGYAFRMIADTTKGPFAPFWQWIGLGDFAWVADPWAARLFIVVGDSWQWIPFIFVVMLAALETVPRDYIEAAHVDGAGSWQIFREITWPQIVPVAATVMLIRVIEAFKIVDLPNIMTSGGPGIATESMTLHAFFSWRANDYGQSGAVAYLLLFVTVVICASFFNYVVLKQLKKK
jgi:multiple sugar transport system permease protein